MANRYFVLGLLLAAEPAHAAPKHQVVEDANADPDIEIEAPKHGATAKVAAEPADDGELHEATPGRTSQGWKVAIGPYLWASSVQADVSLGPLTAGVDLGFLTLARHTRYGAELVVDARHGRIGLHGDLMYGASSFTASKDILGVMTSLTGNAGTLLIDAIAGYQAIDGATFSVEGRSGIRYARNTLQGELGVAGFTLQTPELVIGGADLVVGACATVRPTPRVQLAGAFDVGIAGASDATSSVTLDASFRLSSRLVLTGGWRSLTMQRANLSMTLRGPRVALQYLF